MSPPSTGPCKCGGSPPQLFGACTPCMLSRTPHAELASVQVAQWSSSLNKHHCATLVQLLLNWRCSLGRAAAAGLEACAHRNKPTQQVWPVECAPLDGLLCEGKGGRWLDTHLALPLLTCPRIQRLLLLSR